MHRALRLGLLLLPVLPVAALAVASCTASRPADLGLDAAGRLRPCPDSPNCVNSDEAGRSSSIEPLALAALGVEPDAALARVAEAIEATPRARVVTLEGDYLHAEYTSALFRFVDDLEVRLDREAGVLHLRSASRVGHSDLGANAARVEDLRRRLGAPASPTEAR
jgi:uncharacterized protein (DUF1499 family)